VFVLVATESGRVGGYYTLSSGSINLTDLPADVARKLPRYPAVPVVLLGRLAVALEHQGRGFGAALLFDALRRALAQSAQVGAMAVVVDAKGDAARSFYERYGFHRFTDNEYRLFLPMKTIEALMQEEHG
jgi:GNAT superfamily N-acetyltransferase